MRLNMDFVKQGLAGKPYPKWDSYENHIGPLEGNPPLKKRLSGLTMMGEVTLAAGILLWAARRLEQDVDVTPLYQVAEASFAYQFSPRYMPRTRFERIFGPDDPPAESAFFGLRQQMRRVTMADWYWDVYGNPTQDLFHMAWATNYIMAKADRKDFEGWLFATHERILGVAARPDEPRFKMADFDTEKEYAARVALHRGTPLPPDILSGPVEGDLTALAHDFLRSLDPQTNPYLAPAAEMVEEGFDGQPYA